MSDQCMTCGEVGKHGRKCLVGELEQERDALRAEVERLKGMVRICDEHHLMKASDGARGWQGRTAEVMGWQKRAEAAEAELALVEERFATAERQYSALEQRWLRMLGMARKLERGCDCEYDYRCGRCQAVLDMLEDVNRG